MTATTIRVQMAQRKDTAANWTAANPILLSGEIGYETDTEKFKIGDGTTNWNSLAYLPIPDGSGNLTITGNLEIGSTGTLTFEGSTADGFETTLAVTDPTADRTITLPDVSGTVVTTGDTGTVTSTMIDDGTITDGDINASAAIAGTKISPDFGSQNVTTTGTSTAASFIPTSNTAPTNGVYLPAANTVALSTNGTGRLFVSSTGEISTRQGGFTSIPDGAGSGFTPQIFSSKTSGVAGLGVYVEDGTNNRRAGLFVDQTNAIWGLSSLWSTGQPDFVIRAAANERLRITSAGLVGIGTPSPQTRLQVNTPTNSTGLSIVANLPDAEDYTEIGFRGGVIGNTNIAAIRVVSTVGGNAWPESSLGFFTYPPFPGNTLTERLRITSTGRVGIGTTNVDELLHVESDGATPKIKVESTLADSSPGFRVTNDARSYDIRIDGTNDNLQFYDATASQGRVAIDSSGRLLVGTSSSTNVASTVGALVQTRFSGSFTNFAAVRESGPPVIAIGRANGSAAQIVSNNDVLGEIRFAGADGVDLETPAASIACAVDGTPGANDMPGRLVFSTTADGASSPTEQLRITSDRYVRLASGTGGIQFNGDTASANALDDYEEGTWTPVISDGVNTGSVTAISCRYTKIGRLVYVRGTLLNINTTGLTAGNNLVVAGLPYALQPNVTNSSLAFPVATTNITTTKGLAAGIGNNSTSFVLYEVDSAVFGATPIKVSALTSGNADILIGFSYEVS